jgi:glycerol-3-phosphate O-acyltransferase
MRIAIVVAAFAIIAAIAVVLGKRHARRFQRARRIHIDRFKLKRRHADIELEVFGSRAVVEAIREYARSHHVTTEEAAGKARTYLREIVPKFNLLAYYRVGAPLARAIMHFLYRPVVERNPLRDFTEKAPKGAVVVYLINHRSNADYVLVAHMLFKFVSLSYAIGEWARVWPLNHVFKWFGGYFVRRRYREPLYHAILSTFVQTITKNGVTQGIFIEGGLTRDGAFQRPKLGMLDYIVTAKRDPSFTAPLFFIPTAINYDRVLEDRNLTEELMGREDRSTKTEKLNTTLEFLFKNTLRSALKRFKRYGYAIVTFGKPISVDEFIAAHPAVLAEDFEQRKAALQLLAEETMREISAAIPVVPVPLVAGMFRGRELLSDSEMIDGLSEAMRRLRAGPYTRPWLLREKTAEDVWRAARHVLELRRLIVPGERWRSDLFDESGVPVIEDVWRWNPDEVILRDYYANSLLTFDEVKFRGWPERKPRIGEALDAGASTHVSTA